MKQLFNSYSLFEVFFLQINHHSTESSSKYSTLESLHIVQSWGILNQYLSAMTLMVSIDLSILHLLIILLSLKDVFSWKAIPCLQYLDCNLMPFMIDSLWDNLHSYTNDSILSHFSILFSFAVSHFSHLHWYSCQCFETQGACSSLMMLMQTFM